jgi:hypothetical protein
VKDITTEAQESRAAIEAIAPSHPANAMPRALQFNWIKPNGEPVVKTYIQAELGLFAVEEFSTRLTEILDSFVKGEFGIKVGELFRGEVEMPVNLDAEATQEFVDENEQLINAFIKLVKIVPGLRQDITVLSLGVPRLEMAWAKEQLSEPPYRGGLSVEDGFDILIYFLRQNVPLLRRTLLGKARELVEEFRLLVLDEEQTPASSPSTEEISGTTTQAGTTTMEPPSTPGGTPSNISSPATLGSV